MGCRSRCPLIAGREAALLIPPLPKPPALGFLDPLEVLLNRSTLYQTFRHSWLGQQLLGSLTLTPERLQALGLAGNVQYDIEAITRDGDFAGLQEAWKLTERYIAGIHALARAHNIAFAMVVHPHAQQVAADASPVGRRRHGLGPGLYASTRPFEILEELGRRQGFPVLNLLRLFRDHESREVLFRSDDTHHTPAGARLFAQGIVAGLQQHALIPCLLATHE